jgi:hypothetical protein
MSAVAESGRDCTVRASFLPEHIHDPLHRRMAAVLYLDPVLRIASLCAPDSSRVGPRSLSTAFGQSVEPW